MLERKDLFSTAQEEICFCLDNLTFTDEVALYR